MFVEWMNDFWIMRLKRKTGNLAKRTLIVPWGWVDFYFVKLWGSFGRNKTNNHQKNKETVFPREILLLDFLICQVGFTRIIMPNFNCNNTG